MKRWSNYFLLLVALAATAAALNLYRVNAALRRELAARPVTTSEPRVASARPETPVAPVEVAAPPAASTADAASSSEPESGRGAWRGQRSGQDRRDRGQELMAQALADPNSRAAMLSRFKSQIDRNFGDYFVKLGLDETKIEMLRTLLAERQMARMESGMLERSSDDEQTRAEAEAWRDTKLATTEADINRILGADGLKSLQAYQDSAPQREVIAEIARRASYAGAPLSETANNQLLDVVSRVSTDVPLPRLGGRGAGAGAAAQPVTQQTVDTYLEQLHAQNQAVIEQARGFLTQPQLEALADQQIDVTQQTEARLNFLLRNPDIRGGGPGGFGGLGGFGGGGGGRGPGG